MNSSTRQPLRFNGQLKLLLRFFARPAQAVDEMCRHAPLGAAFFVLMIGGLLLQWALIPFVEQAALQTLDAGLTAPQVELSLKMMRKIQLIALLFYPLTLTAKWLMLGVILALLCQLLGGGTSLRQGLSISAHASLLPLLQTAQVYLILLLSGIESVHRPSDLRPAIGLDMLWTAHDPVADAVLHGLNPFEMAYLLFLLAAVRRTNPAFSMPRAAAAALPFWLMTFAVRIFLGAAGQGGQAGTPA
ncbi:MAG TPA: hypothetical protein VLV83_17845 [Acidobacteriota bacterium]|nr:hypothetical protein [Acidobacteriota bacterium]